MNIVFKKKSQILKQLFKARQLYEGGVLCKNPCNGEHQLVIGDINYLKTKNGYVLTAKVIFRNKIERKIILNSYGKWALILSNNKLLLMKAKLNYPKGTIYLPLNGEGKEIKKFKTQMFSARSEPYVTIQGHIHVGEFFIYVNGKWAKILI